MSSEIVITKLRLKYGTPIKMQPKKDVLLFELDCITCNKNKIKKNLNKACRVICFSNIENDE